MPSTLAEVEVLVRQLDPADQTKLRDRLSQGEAQAATTESADEAVENFHRVLDQIRAAPLSGTEILFLDRESRACTLSMLASGLAQLPPGSGNTR